MASSWITPYLKNFPSLCAPKYSWDSCPLLRKRLANAMVQVFFVSLNSVTRSTFPKIYACLQTPSSSQASLPVTSPPAQLNLSKFGLMVYASGIYSIALNGWVMSRGTLQHSAASQGLAFKRPPRHPILLHHLRALHDSLDFTAPRSHAIWAAALTAFWGCRCLGELLPLSNKSFDPVRNITINCNIRFAPIRDRCAVTIHIPWTKTTRFAGADCSLTQREDIFCPVRALSNHLAINHPSDGSPLFAFRDPSSKNFSLFFLTKDKFISTIKSNYIRFSMYLV